jgi:hypothetical protein
MFLSKLFYLYFIFILKAIRGNLLELLAQFYEKSQNLSLFFVELNKNNILNSLHKPHKNIEEGLVFFNYNTFESIL